jgi:hypothetical protein
MTWRTKVVRVVSGVALLAAFSMAAGADFIDIWRSLFSLFW